MRILQNCFSRFTNFVRESAREVNPLTTGSLPIALLGAFHIEGFGLLVIGAFAIISIPFGVWVVEPFGSTLLNILTTFSVMMFVYFGLFLSATTSYFFVKMNFKRR